MEIIHKIGRSQISGNGSDFFLLTNKKGNFFNIGLSNNSDFNGLYYRSSKYNDLFKILFDIRIDEGNKNNNLLQNSNNINDRYTIINHGTWIERLTKIKADKKDIKESFFLTSNSLIYEIENYYGDVTLTLDMKRIYDNDEWGRKYSSVIKDDKTIFYYHKEGTQNYDLVLMINQTGNLINNWRKVAFKYDSERGMKDSNYVYDALSFKVEGNTRVIITFSHTDDKALNKLDYVIKNQEDIISAIKSSVMKILPYDKGLKYSIALNSFQSLITKHKNNIQGIYAGLPWFYQYWARDELFSLKPLIIEKRYSLVKNILTKYFELFTDPDNTLSLDSADAPGLLCLRTYELLTELTKKKLLKEYFSKMELNYIKEKTIFMFNYIKSKQDLHGFITNKPQATWMDTITTNDVGRPGVRIEIQALFLRVFDLLEFFNIKRVDEKKELKRMIVEWFWNKRRILDGFYPDGQADERIRPNVFLAWYYNPLLFTKEEWESAFDYVLKNNWLEWGGLSSIAKNDPLFTSHHTGLGDVSYHRGDSWYFINNISAIAMFSIFPHKYEKYIEKIKEASEKDLLFQGFIGHSSEISDAKSQNPKGCWSQAWSSATLLELYYVMNRYDDIIRK